MVCNEFGASKILKLQKMEDINSKKMDAGDKLVNLNREASRA